MIIRTSHPQETADPYDSPVTLQKLLLEGECRLGINLGSYACERSSVRNRCSRRRGKDYAPVINDVLRGPGM